MAVDYDEAREALRKWLVKYTGGCELHDGWPCGTCTCYLFGQLLDKSAPEYGEHNDPVDRVNEIWRAILQIRAGR